MSEVHFAIDCGHKKCVIRDLASESGTFVGGKRITEIALRTGDNIVAGQTNFSVNIDGEAESNSIQADAVTDGEIKQPDDGTDVRPPMSSAELCQFLKLDDVVSELARKANVPPYEFMKLLIQEKNWTSALRFASHLLPLKDAVLWGAICTRESVGNGLSDADHAALDAAELWVKTGKDTDRRIAHEAAEATHFETAAGWVALAAFWSEGSMAPIGLPDVFPDERLTGQAITGALLMAAVQTNPLRAEANYDRFLKIADDMIGGRSSTANP